MNRRRADRVTERWQPKAPAPKSLGHLDEPQRRALEIETMVGLGIQRAEIDPTHPNSALLHIVCVLLGELAAENGLLPADPTASLKIAAPPPEASDEPETGTPIERFLAAIEAATARGYNAGIHPPNLAAALRAEADAIERKRE